MDNNRNPGNLPETDREALLDSVLEDFLKEEPPMNETQTEDAESLNVDQLLKEVRELTDDNPAPEPMFRDQEYMDTFGMGEDLDRVFSDEPYVAPEPQEEIPQYTDNGELREEKEEEKPVRKGRPKRKKTYRFFGIPHILATLVWLVLVVVIGVNLGRVIWLCATDLLAFGREEQVVSVTIEEEDTIEDIAQKLKDSGLIQYTQLFEFYADITDAREDISAGTFELNTIYDYNALVNNMTRYSSSREVVRVTIPEGYNCAQMFALLEEKGVCSAEDLGEFAQNGELAEYWFLEGVERNGPYCLEGFLFPDTYDFYINDSAGSVLSKLLNCFENRFSDELIAAIDTLNQRLTATMQSNGCSEEYIAEHQMDIYDIMIVASLIEEETAGVSESFTISSVIYNRLYDWGDTPRYLNIDAALLYAIGHKDVLSAEDLATDTPYNTYLYTGLVPTPISNPGINSISAALNPEDTDYYFYVLDPSTGGHIFSRTSDEHAVAVASVGG